MRKGVFLLLFVMLFFLFKNYLNAQPDLQIPTDSVISPARSLIFIPADWQKVDANSIESEVAFLFSDVAIDLDCIEVFDWLFADDVIYDESIEVEQQIDPPLPCHG